MSEVDLQLAARELNRRLGSTDENAEKTILDAIRILTLNAEIAEREACLAIVDRCVLTVAAREMILARGN